MSDDLNLPDHLQYLRSHIEGAKNEPNYSADTLRHLIKEAVDKSSDRDIIRISETLLQCGIDALKSNRGRWN